MELGIPILQANKLWVEEDGPGDRLEGLARAPLPSYNASFFFCILDSGFLADFQGARLPAGYLERLEVREI